MVGKGLVKRTSHALARNNQEENLLSGLFSVYKIYVLIRVWLHTLQFSKITYRKYTYRQLGTHAEGQKLLFSVRQNAE